MHDLLLPSVHVTLYSFHFHILNTRPSFVLPPLALFSISDSTPVLLMSLGQLFAAHCTTFIFCSHSSTFPPFCDLVLRKQTSTNLRGTQHNTAVEQKQQDYVIKVKKLLFWSILTSPRRQHFLKLEFVNFLFFFLFFILVSRSKSKSKMSWFTLLTLEKNYRIILLS